MLVIWQLVMKLLEKNSELQSLLALQYDKHHEEMMKLIPQVGNNNNNNNFNLNIKIVFQLELRRVILTPLYYPYKL